MKKKYLIASVVLAVILLRGYLFLQTNRMWAGIESCDAPTVEQALQRGAKLFLEKTECPAILSNLLEYNPTPLTRACYKGDEEIVRLLLEHGADPNTADGIGRDPLCSALIYGQSERFSIAMTLIEYGADVSRQSGSYTPVTRALCIREEDSEETVQESLELLQMLLEAGASTTIHQNDGFTLLTWAAHNGHAPAVEYLLDNGYGTVDEADSYQQTALIAAASSALNTPTSGHAAVIELLLARGTDPALRDGDGKTALDHAVEERYQHLYDLLEYEE